MFAGTGTALITPFAKDGTIDEDALRRLVNFQEENGVDVLIPCGSTGESAMLSHEEHIHVVEIVRDEAKKAKILAGAGSNCTSEAVMLSKSAEDLGVDGILSISPYYVKPTQEGLYQHYKAIQDAIDIPVIVYNVPGRTSTNVNVDTILRLAELPGITGVKEASGNFSQIMNILANKPDDFEVLSGDDGLTLGLLCLGADGVISVASNCCPGLLSNMVSSARKGDVGTAREIHERLLPLFSALFCESNPIPIKYAMGRMGFGNGKPRLPLTELSDKGKSILDPVLESLGI
ncbi:MAG: 4-hydroxy-tetrahydrodipicolinate synthase [Thermoplasmata archaeon]|nr:4-hydroxy-tetrahydrodipicolinate synthase [Thermoplasmata archaeon]MBR4244759.1 4-hydroxy-tetrahydrodipicolinate synthase [Candidatus Methanomethylophilaceae archaeon]MBR6213725.1 4-hydroxy-tetrahydrodipicolinate synthase [Candidatus Methanomethylophilaceae archaeon]